MIKMSKLQAVAVGAGIFILGAVVAKVFFNAVFILGLIGSFVVGAAVTIVLIARSRGEKVSDVAEEAFEQVVRPDPGAGERRLREQLTRLNQRLRLESTDMEVIQGGEKLIDLLLNVTPRAMQEASGSEATFNLEKLAEDYLPQLLTGYLRLSEADRSTQRVELLRQLEELSGVVIKMREALDAGRLDQFDTASDFLKAKFA